MNCVLRPVEKQYVLGYPVVKLENIRLAGPLVVQTDVYSRVQEREFAKPFGKNIIDKLSGDKENLHIRHKCHLGSGLFRSSNFFQFLLRFAAFKYDVMHRTLPADFDLAPLGHRIDTARAHTVQTSGYLVGAFSEFSAGVQFSHHKFDRWNLVLWVVAHGNTAAVVDHDGLTDIRQVSDLVCPLLMVVEQTGNQEQR